MSRSHRRFLLGCVFARRLSLLIAVTSSAALAKGVPMQLCVDKSGANGCSTTIQGAVNLVPTGGSAIITIAAGSFAEDVTVSNITVSFVGKGPGMTIADGANNSQLPTFKFTSNFNGEFHGMTIENGSGGGTGSNVSFAPLTTVGGTLKIENCEITGGVSPSGVAPSGAVDFAGKTLIIDSTSIINNHDLGIAIFAGAHAFITNTTISGNSTAGTTASADGCGIQAFLHASVVLDNVTITDNACVAGSGMGQVSEGGGIWLDETSKLSMANSVIANNTVSGGTPAGPDCFSPGTGLKSKGFDLIKDQSACAFTPAKTDLAADTDPSISSLAACPSSALKVQTPMSGSPLIDKGNPGTPTGKAGSGSSSCLPTDECGTARAKASCTIGAKQ